MTQPTQAQIEAAHSAYYKARHDDKPLDECWNAALTAAAKVGECKTCGGLGYVVYDVEWDPYPVQCPDCKTSAQVGEPDWQRGYEAGMKSAAPAIAVLQADVAATIERCAQVLEAAYAECSTLNLLHGAARLRALKDAP